jgi:hypothetical protein
MARGSISAKEGQTVEDDRLDVHATIGPSAAVRMGIIEANKIYSRPSG